MWSNCSIKVMSNEAMKGKRIGLIVALLISAVFALFAAAQGKVTAEEAKAIAKQGPRGMVWVPGGEFTMGWDGPEARFEEKPAHRVRVDGFWMDSAEVTNARFGAFVEATGYRTTAQRKPDWDELSKQLRPGTPKPAEQMLRSSEGLRSHSECTGHRGQSVV